MWFCIVFLGFFMKFLNSIIVFLLGFLNAIVHENSWCKLIFQDTVNLWRPALELNGLPCVNKVLLYFTLLYFTNYKNLFCQTSKKLGSSSRVLLFSLPLIKWV